jgi:hypothetical protein
MIDAHKALKNKDEVRYETLRYIYDLTNGLTTRSVDFSKYFGCTNSRQEEEQYADIRNAINYLEEENLIKWDSDEEYSITHRGVKEVEQSIKNPERSTEHFSPVIQFYTAPVGTVQNGNNNNSYVSQINNSSSEIQNSIQDLKGLVSSLPEKCQSDASEVIEDLREEMENPTKQSRLKSSLVTLWALGKDVASFANSVSAVAQRFGIDLSNF